MKAARFSREFCEFVLRQCQEAGFPCLPDPEDPIVSIRYIGNMWHAMDGESQLQKLGRFAEDLGIVECTIKRHRCIRLSRANMLLDAGE